MIYRNSFLLVDRNVPSTKKYLTFFFGPWYAEPQVTEKFHQDSPQTAVWSRRRSSRSCSPLTGNVPDILLHLETEMKTALVEKSTYTQRTLKATRVPYHVSIMMWCQFFVFFKRTLESLRSAACVRWKLQFIPHFHFLF